MHVPLRGATPPGRGYHGGVRVWFDDLRDARLGPRWYATVTIAEACGWSLRGWMRSVELPAFRRFPGLRPVDAILAATEPFDGWLCEEEPSIRIQATHRQLVIRRSVPEGGDGAREAGEVETRLLATLAADASVRVTGWSFAVNESERVLASSSAEADAATALCDRLGRPAPLPRVPALVLDAEGTRVVLDDEAWLALAWVHLLFGRAGGIGERVVATGGLLRGDAIDDLRAFVVDARARLGGVYRNPLLPAAHKRLSWQWHAATRLEWMLRNVWKAAEPPALAARLGEVDALVRRARESGGTVRIEVREPAPRAGGAPFAR